jgi:hypothetical protein
VVFYCVIDLFSNNVIQEPDDDTKEIDKGINASLLIKVSIGTSSFAFVYMTRDKTW